MNDDTASREPRDTQAGAATEPETASSPEDPRRRELIRRLGGYGASLPVAMTALVSPRTSRAVGGSDGGSDWAP